MSHRTGEIFRVVLNFTPKDPDIFWCLNTNANLFTPEINYFHSNISINDKLLPQFSCKDQHVAPPSLHEKQNVYTNTRINIHVIQYAF